MGVKEGREESDMGDHQRKEFVAWLRDEAYEEWCEVAYDEHGHSSVRSLHTEPD